MFSKDNPKKLAISDLFDDIKLTAGGANLDGYIPLGDMTYQTPRHSIHLGTRCIVKPSKEVIDFMVKAGYGYPTKSSASINNFISFTSTMNGFEFTPAIAGSVDPEELAAFRDSAEIAGDCLVKNAYQKFHKLHPNFAMRSCIEPKGIQLSNIEQHARSVWLAVGVTLKNEEIIKKAEKGDFNKFYLNQARLDFLSKKFGIDVPTVHKDKRVEQDDSLSLG